MPDFTPTDLEALVRQRAPEIARDIQSAAQRAHNEADLAASVERLLERFAKNFDVTLHLDRERTLVNGRADAVYNRFVIEYEPPGSLRKSNSYAHNQHAVGQVKQYMDGLERLDRQKKERLAGHRARVQAIEAEIDRLAAQLWGLTDDELREIQESLAELA